MPRSRPYLGPSVFSSGITSTSANASRESVSRTRLTESSSATRSDAARRGRAGRIVAGDEQLGQRLAGLIPDADRACRPSSTTERTLSISSSTAWSASIGCGDG